MAKSAKRIPAGSPVEDLRQPAPAAAPAAVSAEGSSGEGTEGGRETPPTNAGAVASASDPIPVIPSESTAQGGSGDPAAPAGFPDPERAVNETFVKHPEAFAAGSIDRAAVKVTAKRDGFRRAGLSHRVAGVVHPAGTLTDGQFAALLFEPELVVEVLAP